MGFLGVFVVAGVLGVVIEGDDARVVCWACGGVRSRSGGKGG